MSTTTVPEVADLKNAIESKDAAAVAAWYAADATLTILDRDHPPGSPLVYRGRTEILGYYTDICGRNIEHRVRNLVSTPKAWPTPSTAATPTARLWPV